MSNRKGLRSFTFVLFALLVLAVGTGGCGSKPASPELGLKPGAESDAGVTATGAAEASGTTSPKTPGAAGDDAAAGSGAGAPGQSASDGSGASGGTSGGSTGTNGSGAASTAPKRIRINWWNDTSANSPKSPSIVFDGKTVKPKAGKSDVLSIGPCPVGKDLKLTIYPDGTGGKKLVATFRVDASMVAGSDQDAIHIEVRDDRVRVLGNPIPNFEASFAR